MTSPDDAWANGAFYEAYVGRWSRLAAQALIASLGLPAGGCWLDVGCGTGALAQVILENAAPRAVVGVDPSEGFLDQARRQVSDHRARFDPGDARDLPYEAAAFDAVVSGLVLNFLPEPAHGVAEMARVTRRGGVVAAYVWDYTGQMQLMRQFWDAAVALDPAARALDEGRRFAPICRPEALGALWTTAGLRAVDAWAIDVPARFRDFDDYWSPFLGGQGPAPSYTMFLSEERRTALRDRIRETLPISADGSIALIARAWAVRGAR